MSLGDQSWFWQKGYVCRKKLLELCILVFLLTIISVDKVYFFIDSHLPAVICHLLAQSKEKVLTEIAVA